MPPAAESPKVDAVEAYIRSGHRKVQGWLRPEAAILIARLGQHQRVSGAVGEIGIHHGKLFLLLALLRGVDEHAVALDLFQHQQLNVDHSGRGNRAQFDKNLARWVGSQARLSIQAVDSTAVTPEALMGWGHGRFRLFSVDGGHTADITDSDLTLASAVLEEGGLVVLDDYFNQSWPGVSEGTNRFLSRAPGLVPVGAAHGKMFLTTPGSQEHYRQVMRDIALDRSWRVSEQTFFGEAQVLIATRTRRNRARTMLRGGVRRLLRR